MLETMITVLGWAFTVCILVLMTGGMIFLAIKFIIWLTHVINEEGITINR